MMPPTDEDIAWFKSTFHPIPKAALPDDCIEYTIQVLSSSLDVNNDSETRLRLKEIQKFASLLQKEWLYEYIWQRQGFSLEIEKTDDGKVGTAVGSPSHRGLTTNPGLSLLRGRTEYGDSIEDEWVIVWLLREISKRYSDSWIKVSDNDGEFLLIEASGSLPTWLEPDVAENRVWINDGHLKIIKPASGARSAKRTEEKLTIQDARHIILKEPKRLMNSSTMEREAFFRLRNYPGQIKDNMHHALVSIPRTMAFLLEKGPSYVAPAVESFYLRDPISLKKLDSEQGMSDLPIPVADLVTVSVRFPKVAYAQLRSQEFTAPTALQHLIQGKHGSSDSAAAETGMKLICGFEMLLTDSQHQDKTSVREMKLLLEDLDAGEESLPTDVELSGWSKREDNEDWLNINYQDLDTELGGNKATASKENTRGFGDTTTQENLQRIVKQFEEFLNDDDAGLDGAGGLDDDDSDNDDPDDSSTEEEDHDAEFGEDDFTRLMQEMMGMPPEVMQELMKGALGSDAAASEAGKTATARSKEKVAKGQATDAEFDEEFEAHMRHIEAELRENGALDLNAKTPKDRALKGTVENDGEDSDLSDDDLDDNDIDINLAQNLLASLKAQAGEAGPGGNMMGMFDGAMPRLDELDEEEAEAGPSKPTK
jgi:hypothetical protein